MQNEHYIRQELDLAYEHRPDFAARIIQAIDEETLVGGNYITQVDGRPCGCFYGYYTGAVHTLEALYKSSPVPLLFHSNSYMLYSDVPYKMGQTLRSLDTLAEEEAERVLKDYFSDERSDDSGSYIHFCNTPIEEYLLYKEDEDYSEFRALLVPYAERYQSSLVAQPE